MLSESNLHKNFSIYNNPPTAKPLRLPSPSESGISTTTTGSTTDRVRMNSVDDLEVEAIELDESLSNPRTTFKVQPPSNLLVTSTPPAVRENFVTKLWSFLNSNPDSELIRWNQTGDMLIIDDTNLFVEKVAKVIWRQSAYPSFAAQMFKYGFVAGITPEAGLNARVWRHVFLTRNSTTSDLAQVQRYESERRKARLDNPNRRKRARKPKTSPFHHTHRSHHQEASGSGSEDDRGMTITRSNPGVMIIGAGNRKLDQFRELTRPSVSRGVTPPIDPASISTPNPIILPPPQSVRTRPNAFRTSPPQASSSDPSSSTSRREPPPTYITSFTPRTPVLPDFKSYSYYSKSPASSTFLSRTDPRSTGAELAPIRAPRPESDEGFSSPRTDGEEEDVTMNEVTAENSKNLSECRFKRRMSDFEPDGRHCRKRPKVQVREQSEGEDSHGAEEDDIGSEERDRVDDENMPIPYYRLTRPAYTTPSARVNFLSRLWDYLVTTPDSEYIGWDESGELLVIKDSELFIERVARKLWNMGGYHSFARQMNKYGFQAHNSRRKSTNSKIWKHETLTRDSSTAEISGVHRKPDGHTRVHRAVTTTGNRWNPKKQEEQEAEGDAEGDVGRDGTHAGGEEEESS